MMDRFNRLAMAGVVIWLISVSGRVGIWTYLRGQLDGTSGLPRIELFRYLSYFSLGQGLITLAVHVGIAIWLYRWAERIGGRAWVWAVFGFFFGLIAPIILCLASLMRNFTVKPAESPA